MSKKLEAINDDFGECVALRKGLKGALNSMACILIVEIFSVEGIWIGRLILTSAVALSVTLFFYLQNGKLVHQCLLTPNNVNGGMSIRERKTFQQAFVTEDELLEGGGDVEEDFNANINAPGMKFRGKKSLSKKNRLFAKTVLKKE
eukprot:g2207.t1